MSWNGNHYIDYQDCHYLGDRYMLCSGVARYLVPSTGPVALGGIDLWISGSRRALHQVPVTCSWLGSGLPVTNNPFYFELYNNACGFTLYRKMTPRHYTFTMLLTWMRAETIRNSNE